MTPSASGDRPDVQNRTPFPEKIGPFARHFNLLAYPCPIFTKIITDDRIIRSSHGRSGPDAKDPNLDAM